MRETCEVVQHTTGKPISPTMETLVWFCYQKTIL